MRNAELGQYDHAWMRIATWFQCCGLLWASLTIMETQSALASDHGAPPTQVINVVDDVHGEKITDPYRWLEDAKSPETRSWIEAQNARTTAVLSKFSGREALARRAGELLKVDSIGTPTARGKRYFFSKRDADQDLPVICLRNGLNGKDEVLLDPQLVNKEHTTTYSVLDVSEDGQLLIYGVRQGGEDEVSVKFFDVETRKDLDFELPRARFFGISLTPDKKTLFYTIHGKEGSRVYRRPFGRDGQAELIFGEGYEPLVGISPNLSRDGRYLLLHIWYGSAGTKTDIYFQDLQQADSKIRPLVNDLPARFEAEAVGNECYLQTNWEAPHGRLMRVDLDHPERANWRETIPTSDSVMEGFSLVGGNVYVQFLDQVRSRVTVYDPTGKKLRDIQFPALGTVSGIGGEWKQHEAFYSFSSYHIPTTIFREDTQTGEQFVWAKSKVPVESDRFEVRQVFYKSKDGTQIPMFLVHRKDLKRDGQNPTILYGYGGFNISLTPAFSAKAVQWCELGGVFAVANLRGGGEFGEDWHKAGMGEHKQNVFDDFYAAADWLTREKYTSSEKLAIDGRSNGGLLVGTALTQRPELFRAVVCGYPLLDMVRFHKFLVARFWIPEYGSSDDPKQFQVLKAYSPYHNVKVGTKYPAVMFVTGDADTRVDPLHARKMTALLQAATGSDHPVLLRYDTKLGHTGARPVSHTIDDVTNELSFLCQELGVSTAP
jgi:prolyl oligopeptidase